MEGRATVYSGSMSQGRDHVTSLSRITADVLQIPIENIDVVEGDTRHFAESDWKMSLGATLADE